ncbi:MazG-like family protein [Streptomyces sp. NPDC001153]
MNAEEATSIAITGQTTLGELWQVIGALSDVCASAGAHLPEEELKALQVGKVAEEAGEAMHALHGLKGLTTCADGHDWDEVTNDLVGAVLAAMIALRYVNGDRAPEEFNRIVFRRTRRGREALEVAAA